MKFMKQIYDHKLRFAKTVALFLAYFTLGLNLGILGPTILDLQIAVNATFNHVTWVMPSRAGGYALGSFICKPVN